jgi:hypothetical protein
MLSSLPLVSKGCQYTGQPYLGPPQRTRQERHDRMREQDPPLNINPASPAYLQDEAVKEADWNLIQEFHHAIESDTMLTCDRCHKRWFNLDLKNGICGKCRRADAQIENGEPFLYDSLNHADPGLMITFLPKLTGVEEMLIARVHVFMQAWLKRGA